MTLEEDEELRKQARKRLEKQRDFHTHLVSYLVVNAMLVGIWALTGAGYFWPAWVMLAWGVGLALNFWDVYHRHPITDADIDRELKRRES
ncbi:MAG: 2TM domain-containing protein [Acidimicrobiia bacterium]|nr:2TM domain-containing protein [Acidimicrobiia bacterium]